MTLEARLFQDDYRNREIKVQLNDTEALQTEARLAMVLIERWGLVAATPDGEDSQGRQRMRRMSAGELVSEACETAKLALEQFRERGWTLALPSLAEQEAFRNEVGLKE